MIYCANQGGDYLGLDSSDKNLRISLGSFATGVCVVCAISSGNYRGFTASSFCSVSLDPVLLSVCLAVNSGCMDIFEDCSHFSISVLNVEQGGIADHFANFEGDRFVGVDYFLSPLGCPLISKSLAWFDCYCERRIILGDHVMLVGKVCNYSSAQGEPLVYFRGNYKNNITKL